VVKTEHGTRNQLVPQQRWCAGGVGPYKQTSHYSTSRTFGFGGDARLPS